MQKSCKRHARRDWVGGYVEDVDGKKHLFDTWSGKDPRIVDERK